MHATHDMRIGYYRDTHRRRVAAEDPRHQRLIRRSGVHDSAPARRRSSQPVNVGSFRTGLRAWLDEHDLTPGPTTRCRAICGNSPGSAAYLDDADWMRYGWPVEVGGLGGPVVLRAIVGEEVVGRRLAEPGPIGCSRCSHPR